MLLQVMEPVFAPARYDVITYPEPLFCPLYSETSNTYSKADPCADIMITGFYLPRMNGFELLKKQAGSGCTLLSGNKAIISSKLPDDLVKSIGEQGIAYLEEPIDLLELSAWVIECENRIRATKPPACKRDAKRYSVERKVRCLIGLDEAIVNAAMINTSDTGVCLRLPENIKKGLIVRFVKDPSLHSQHAVVRWISEDHDGFYTAGLRYCEPLNESMSRGNMAA